MLFNMPDDGGIVLMHKVVGEHDDSIDIPDEYFNMLDICDHAIDVHTHPNYNCIPSAMDIAFYLSNPDIREAYIVGKDAIAHITFKEDREYVAPHTVEKVYNQIVQGIADDYDNFVESVTSKDICDPFYLTSFTNVGQDTIAEAMFTEASWQLMGHFKLTDFALYELPDYFQKKD
ncbi:hypothetical protein [Bacteroides sp.]|uniref:hypothetical protein n=1 Tax=Bacteroides sp. TaxID=29523 RepID=UPI002636B1BF|nr:hypothetical protein [Bacteroides sp.]MDD3041047.1 hypothetical protein [Bacteroides sp.]